MKTLKNWFVVAMATMMLVALTTNGFAGGAKLPGSNIKAATADTVIVPEQVRVTFQTKYPQATNVVCYKYEYMEDEYKETYPGYYDANNY